MYKERFQIGVVSR